MKSILQLKPEFEKIIDRKNPIMLEHRSESKAWSDCYYCHPNTSQAFTLQKRVSALAKEQPDLYAALLPIVNEAIAKQAEITVAKDAALKASNEKKAVAQAKRDEKETIKKNPYHKLDPQVADILRQVAEPYRTAAITMETTRLTHQRDEVVRLGEMFGSLDPRVMFPYKKGDHWGNQANSFKVTEAMKYLDMPEGTWTLRDNTDAIIKAHAERFANDIVSSFIHKVGTKLSGIVEKKNGTHTVSITGGSLQDYWMHFKFIGGASFDVQSQVVWKTSVNGVHFAQFPTCFRNVKLSNGTKMELPSEAKMKEAFV